MPVLVDQAPFLLFLERVGNASLWLVWMGNFLTKCWFVAAAESSPPSSVLLLLFERCITLIDLLTDLFSVTGQFGLVVKISCSFSLGGITA